MTDDAIDRRMSQQSRSCTTPDGRKFRVASRRRFVVVLLAETGAIIIDYRTDEMDRALERWTEMVMRGYAPRAVFVCDTKTDSILRPRGGDL